MAAAISSEERLYRMAREAAVSRYGRGWDLLGQTAQRSAVVEEVFFITCGQDSSVSGEVVMRILRHVQGRVADDFPEARR